MNTTNNLVWIDLEMTGLNPETDTILEIATIITDNELNELAVCPSFVIHHSDSVLSAISPEVKKLLQSTGIFEAVKTSTISLEQAEEETLECIQKYCTANTAVLCGNSVWVDRLFLKKYMPKLHAFLHYRLIDVSTVKELVKRWYKKNPNTEFKKKNMHRALDDIRESIAELQYYRDQFFIKMYE